MLINWKKFKSDSPPELENIKEKSTPDDVVFVECSTPDSSSTTSEQPKSNVKDDSDQINKSFNSNRSSNRLSENSEEVH